MHATSYCGVYRGIVVDNNDPLDAGRIRMVVPQVSGEEVTEWAWPVTGSVAQTKYPYGTFSSSATQLVSAANTATVATLDITEDLNSILLVSNSQVKALYTGDYSLQFSAQFARTSGSSAVQADVWLRKNGVDIPRTNSRVTLQGNPNEDLVTLSYILDLKENDYIEVVFSSADSSVGLIGYSGLTSPTRPTIPGIILSINLVGKFKPKAGSGAWVMYEGGDPNFPLWLGTF